MLNRDEPVAKLGLDCLFIHLGTLFGELRFRDINPFFSLLTHPNNTTHLL